MIPFAPCCSNLLLFVFSNFRAFVIGFHLRFAESEITMRITKKCSLLCECLPTLHKRPTEGLPLFSSLHYLRVPLFKILPYFIEIKPPRNLVLQFDEV